MYALVIYTQDHIHYVCNTSLLPANWACNKISKVKWVDGKSYPAKIICIHDSANFLYKLSFSMQGITQPFVAIESCNITEHYLKETSDNHSIFTDVNTSPRIVDIDAVDVSTWPMDLDSTPESGKVSGTQNEVDDGVENNMEYSSDNLINDPTYNYAENDLSNESSIITEFQNESVTSAELPNEVIVNTASPNQMTRTAELATALENVGLADVHTSTRIGIPRFCGPKKSWSTEEKNAVMQAFESCLSTEKLPPYRDVETAKVNNVALSNRSREAIRLWIKNQIVKKRQSANSTPNAKRKVLKRKRWTDEEKVSLFSEFGQYIKGSTLPSQAEIQQSIERCTYLRKRSIK